MPHYKAKSLIQEDDGYTYGIVEIDGKTIKVQFGYLIDGKWHLERPDNS